MANEATGQEAGAVYVSVMPSGRGFSKAMDRDLAGAFTGAAARGTSTFGRMFRRVAAIGAGVLATVGLGKLVKETVALGVSYNTLEQTSRAAFTTILGSAEAAGAMMSEIREFAKTSPFPRQAFIEATRQMLGFGFAAKDVVPILGIIQDSVAAMGGGADEIKLLTEVFSTIKATGRVMADDLNRLSQVGINAWEILAQASGVSIGEMRKNVSEGSVDAATAIAQLTTGMQKRFGGAAENIKNTWLGSVDRIKGAWRDLSSALVAPFIDPDGGGFAVEWANKFADLLRSIEASPAFDKLTDGLSRFVAKLDPLVSGSLSAVALLFEEDGPKKFAERLRELAAQFPALGTFLDIMDALHPLLPAIGEILTALGPEMLRLAPAFADIAEALVPLIPPLANLIIALVPSLLELLPPTVDLLTALVGILTQTTDAGVDLNPVLQFLAGVVSFITGALASGLTQWGKFFDAIRDGKVTLSEFLDILYNVPGAAGEIGRGVVQFFYDIINGVYGFLNGIIGGIESVIDAVTNALGLGNIVNFLRLPKLPTVEQILGLMSGPGVPRRSVVGNVPVPMADGGTILPRPGGTLILAAEAGRAESVVDTGKLNQLLDLAINDGGPRIEQNITFVNPVVRDPVQDARTTADILGALA